MTTTDHAPLPCPTCKVPRAFIRYDTKPGKDGREAKWPVYEPCRNRDCKTGRKVLAREGQPEVLPEYKPLPEPKPTKAYAQYQLSNLNSLFVIYEEMSGAVKALGSDHVIMRPEDVQSIWDRCHDKHSELARIEWDEKQSLSPMTISYKTYGHWHSVEVRPDPELKHTKGYGFFGVVTKAAQAIIGLDLAEAELKLAALSANTQ